MRRLLIRCRSIDWEMAGGWALGCFFCLAAWYLALHLALWAWRLAVN